MAPRFLGYFVIVYRTPTLKKSCISYNGCLGVKLIYFLNFALEQPLLEMCAFLRLGYSIQSQNIQKTPNKLWAISSPKKAAHFKQWLLRGKIKKKHVFFLILFLSRHCLKCPTSSGCGTVYNLKMSKEVYRNKELYSQHFIFFVTY